LLTSNASAELVGQWKLDDGAGTTAMDASGKGNHGTLEDDPIFMDGKFVLALAFDGSRVAIPASDSLTADLFQGSFTMSAWINPADWTADYQFIVAKSYDGGDREYRIRNQGSNLMFHITHDGGSIKSLEMPLADVPIGEWHYVTGTWDSITGEMKFYLDSVLKDSSVVNQGLTLHDGPAPFSVGASGTKPI